jgi:hypothetical protein
MRSRRASHGVARPLNCGGYAPLVTVSHVIATLRGVTR